MKKLITLEKIIKFFNDKGFIPTIPSSEKYHPLLRSLNGPVEIIPSPGEDKSIKILGGHRQLKWEVVDGDTGETLEKWEKVSGCFSESICIWKKEQKPTT